MGAPSNGLWTWGLPQRQEDLIVAVVVGAVQMDGLGKAGEAQFLPARFADVERLQATAHVRTVNQFLAGQLLRVADTLGNQDSIHDSPVVKIFADLVLRCLAFALVDHVFEDVLDRRIVLADSIDVECSVTLAGCTCWACILVAAGPPHADQMIHPEVVTPLPPRRLGSSHPNPADRANRAGRAARQARPNPGFAFVWFQRGRA